MEPPNPPMKPQPIKEAIKLEAMCTNFETKVSRSELPFMTSAQIQVDWPIQDRGEKIRIGLLRLPVLKVYSNAIDYGQVLEQWFWELPSRKLMHNESTREHHYLYPHENKFGLPKSFNMDLDMNEGTLSFRIGEKDLGVAFKNLKNHELFLAFYTKGGKLDRAKVWRLKFE